MTFFDSAISSPPPKIIKSETATPAAASSTGNPAAEPKMPTKTATEDQMSVLV
jgi:hypothetical protein